MKKLEKLYYSLFTFMLVSCSADIVIEQKVLPISYLHDNVYVETKVWSYNNTDRILEMHIGNFVPISLIDSTKTAQKIIADSCVLKIKKNMTAFNK